MELKNALAVCLICLFSATIVVLIARSLDSQAAARLEPHLVRIVEELQAIRSSGGPAGTTGAPIGDSLRDSLLVYYFHGNQRCPTCRAIESQSHATVLQDFAEHLGRGEVVWKTVNYEEQTGTELATQFDVQVPVVVVARMKDGQIDNWNRLDDVWGLVDDQPAFAKYVGDEIRAMLAVAEPDSSGARTVDPPAILIPSGDVNEPPGETDPANIPIPE